MLATFAHRASMDAQKHSKTEPWHRPGESCDPYHMLIVLCDIYYVTGNGMCNGFFFINKDYKKICEQMSLFPLVL